MNVTGKSENGIVISGRTHEIRNIEFENINLIIDKWVRDFNNHTKDYTPADDFKPEDVYGKINGLYLEKVKKVRGKNFNVSFTERM